MATVRPFRGWRYGQRQVTSLAAVTCPPYDVITPEQQQAFYHRSPYNIIRLELGESRPTDSESGNRYTRARDTLAAWQRDHILVRDDRPAFYLYEQHFHDGTAPVRRRSLLVALTLVPFSSGEVVPHEETMSGPKADRLALLRTVQANISPIFGLYDDPGGQVASVLEAAAATPPAEEFADEAGETHRLWLLTDPAQNAHIAAALASRQVLIADGHHRYETAFAYSQDTASPEGASAILIALVADGDPGLRIYPTHRTIAGVEGSVLAAARARIGELFEMEELGALAAGPAVIEDALGRSRMPSFAVAGLPEGRISLLTPRDGWQRALPGGHSAAWQSLDLVALDQLLLQDLLGINVDIEGEGRVRFTRDLPGALAGVQTAELQLAAFLHAPTAKIIREVASAGDRMPHKSTYFYPKMRTGLVLRTI